ncbi:hypothetical protein GCM10010269_61090 [Streptomyces humidus]|uniref:Uncharacterized protein n=1 Tax=Streptomyces humidus TaxID=52259 RepID=A0A918G277_9ACTN|nr:hypothetical protein GCM10010269_61090 [Streptomyces humidus]
MTAAVRVCPAAPHSATADPMPSTARVANRSRIRPGSGATKALFSKLPRPFPALMRHRADAPCDTTRATA